MVECSDDDDQILGDFIDPPSGLVNGVNCLMSPNFHRSFWEINGATPETIERLTEMLRHAG